MNSSDAVAALRRLDVELGVSVGNRIIESRVFSTPRHGMLNLHHGHIPRFRGGPPAFWEIYGGETHMGVCVHRIDDRIDHGELLVRDEVPVLPGDDPRTLMERAYEVDAELVARAVRAIARGEARAIPVDTATGVVRTLPSRKELRALQARIGRRVRHDDFRRARLPEVKAPPLNRSEDDSPSSSRAR